MSIAANTSKHITFDMAFVDSMPQYFVWTEPAAESPLAAERYQFIFGTVHSPAVIRISSSTVAPGLAFRSQWAIHLNSLYLIRECTMPFDSVLRCREPTYLGTLIFSAMDSCFSF